MARLRKLGRSGRYFLVFKDVTRQPKEKSVPLGTSDGRAARSRATKLEKLVDRGALDPWNYSPEELPWRHRRLSAADAAERFLEAKEATLAPKSVRGYRSHLQEGLLRMIPDGLPLSGITSAHIAAYVNRVQVMSDGTRKEPANATRRARYRHIGAWLRWCAEHELLPEGTDVKKLLGKMPKGSARHPAYATKADVEKVIAALEAHVELEATEGRPMREGEVVWAIPPITFALYTGMRRGEIVNARWSWVRWAPDGSASITVQATEDWTPKGKRARTIPVCGPALAVLRKLREEREARGKLAEDGPLFLGATGRKLDPERLSKRWKMGVRLAKLDPRLNFHSLRHGTASALVQAGVPLQIVGEVLGHSSLTVTTLYAHLEPVHVRKAVEEVFGEKRGRLAAARRKARERRAVRRRAARRKSPASISAVVSAEMP